MCGSHMNVIPPDAIYNYKYLQVTTVNYLQVTQFNSFIVGLHL